MKTPGQILSTQQGELPPRRVDPYHDRRPVKGDAQARPEAASITTETKTMVNMIFARFMAIYGHKFKSCFETQDEIRIAKREWALSLQYYSEAELVRAIDRCKETLAWMPTVSEFLEVLHDMGGDYGLPSSRQAYYEACRFADRPSQRQWSHQAVYHAGKATEWFRLRSEVEARVFPEFDYNYQIICRRVRAGEQLDEAVPVALENKSDNTFSAFIQSWGEAQGITPEQATTLLFYMTKPAGTAIRQRFKQVSEDRARQWGLKLQLPDDYQ